MITLFDITSTRPGNYYPLPLAHRYGSEWEMNFWDAIYYLAAHRTLPLGVTARTVATLMAGGVLDEERYIAVRHHFMRVWKEAIRAGWLVERTPNHQKALKINTGTLRHNYRSARRVYIFDLSASPVSQPHLLKPRGYIEYGWPGVINGVYPKRLLNFLLGHPRLAQSDATSGYPLVDLFNEFRAELKQAAGVSSHPEWIKEAFDQLHHLDLIGGTAGRCHLNRNRLNSPPPGNRPEANDLIFQADWLTAHVEDPHRAYLAHEVLQMSRRPSIYFWQIYLHLAGLDNQQLEQLRLHLANKTISSDEWAEWVQMFNQNRPGKLSSHESETQLFDLSRQPVWRLPLSLPLAIRLRLQIGQSRILTTARMFVIFWQDQSVLTAMEPLPVTLTLLNDAGQTLAPPLTVDLPSDLSQWRLSFNLTDLLLAEFNHSSLWLELATSPDQAGTTRWHGQVWFELSLSG